MRQPRKTQPVPVMMAASLASASAETIFLRGLMMASGTCSPAEYTRMVTEKMHAAQLSTAAMLSGKGPAAILSPWHRAARANAKRLRHK